MRRRTALQGQAHRAAVLPSRRPAVNGWGVCRVHGARGGARPGKANPAYRHGGRTREMATLRAAMAELVRAGREAAERLTTD